MTEDIVPFGCCVFLSGLFVSRHYMMAHGKPTERGLHSDITSEVRRILAQFHALHAFSFLQGGLTSFPCQVICCKVIQATAMQATCT